MDFQSLNEFSQRCAADGGTFVAPDQCRDASGNCFQYVGPNSAISCQAGGLPSAGGSTSILVLAGLAIGVFLLLRK